MRWDFIDTLHCPYSGSRFSRSKFGEENGSEIDHGIITSEAGDFPVISGILRLKVDEYRSSLVNLIKNRKYEQALLTALEMPSYSRVGTAVNFVDRAANSRGLGAIERCVRLLKKPQYQAFTDAAETLAGTVKRLKSRSWANWQIYRFSMPAFLPTYPLLHLIEGDGRVLDFGCGVGHASFLISRSVPGPLITCVDHQFSLLYLARKFFLRDANFLCLDGDYLLPFESSYFSTVFSSDVLHLIDSKVGLSQEFQRVVGENGAIILPHLHNRLSPVQFGKSLTPEGYSALFEGIERRIVPEDWVFDQFILNDSLDLERKWTPHELHGAIKGLSIVVSKNTSLFHRYAGLWKRHADRIMNPTVNPLYRATGHAGKWILKKEAPDSTGKISSGGDTYLPNTVSLELASLDQKAILGLKVSDPLAFGELARNFVIIDTPERFL